MRISESTKYHTATQDLQKTSQKMEALTQKITSGKRVEKPSDDPVAFVQAEKLKSSIKDSERTRENLFFSKSWLDQVDQNTDTMLELLQKIKIKAINAANSYVSREQLNTLNLEIDIMRDQLLQLGNSRWGKTRLFAGSATLKDPLMENSSEHPSTVFYPYPRYRTLESFDPKELDKPIENVPEKSVITFEYEDPEEGIAHKVDIPVKSQDTVRQILDSINTRIAGENFMKKDPSSPTDFKQDMYLSHGVDGRIYMDLSEGIKLVSIDIPDVLKDVFNFGIVKNPLNLKDGDLDQAPVFDPNNSPYGEFFDGYSEKKFIVKITKPGILGEALYSVSDDYGKTWGAEKTIQLKNEITSPESLSGNEIDLVFDPNATDIYFTKNLEFRSDPHKRVSYVGNEDSREIPINDQDRVKVNITAKDLFFQNDAGGINVFDTLGQLKINIDRENFDQISKLVGDMDIAINQMLKARGKVGAAMNKLEMFREHAEKDEVTKTENLSELEDLDMPKAISDLKQKEAHNQVAMSASSKILQPGLISFLR